MTAASPKYIKKNFKLSLNKMDNPAEFSKHNKNTIRDAVELITKYKNYFKWSDNPEDVLEVGCASGEITFEVVYPLVEPHLKELIGSDVASSAIEIANELHKKPKLSFTTIDIAEDGLWKKYENRFGHIISFYTLHLVPNPERWTENLFKMLKSNGQVFVVMVLPPHPFPMTTKLQRAEKDPRWSKYMAESPELFTDFGENPFETIKSLFENAGFVIDIAEVNKLKSVYPSFKSLSATVLAANNILKHVPEDIRPSYIEDFLKKIEECVQHDESGTYFYDKNVLALIGSKP
ncbi:juvenile hormone acid O-methyltransferase-like isoform X1 [Onthophagus taurus]|uniref:juvenile hormone acid O-methyltransferase-like isoform X1 n=2 Tax=Onthophagus taurus TaxID=166361 RepID=UPI0039BE20A4